MENSTEKFLDFNGKSIYFKSAEGKWWIAIKPICDALNINYSHHLITLKNDEKLGQLYRQYDIVAADNKLRKMVCLPEEFIYGWLFQLNSTSPELKAFQWKCYEVLYDYFHGAITQRSEALKTKTKAQLRIEEIQRQFLESPEGKELSELRSVVKKESNNLRKQDLEFITTQMELWNSETS